MEQEDDLVNLTNNPEKIGQALLLHNQPQNMTENNISLWETKL